MLEIRIAKPCPQTWTAMKGDDQVRHCGSCQKNVYNIAAMTEAEVEALIRRTEGHFCARIYRRTDGRVLTADCPKGVAAVRRKRTLAVTGAFAAFAGVLLPALRPATTGAIRVHVVRHQAEEEPPLTGKVEMPDATLGEVAVHPPARREHLEVQMGAPTILKK